MSSKLFAFFISFCLWQGRAVKCCFYLCTSHDTCTMASGSEDHGCSNYCNKLKYFHSSLSILLYQIQVLSRRVIPVGIYLQSQSQFKHSFNTIFLVYILARKKLWYSISSVLNLKITKNSISTMSSEESNTEMSKLHIYQV